MANQRIIEYIEKNKNQYSLEILRAELIKAGHSEKDIDEAIQKLSGAKRAERWYIRVGYFVVGMIAGGVASYVIWFIFIIIAGVLYWSTHIGFIIILVILTAASNITIAYFIVKKRYPKIFAGYMFGALVPVILSIVGILLFFMAFSVSW